MRRLVLLWMAAAALAGAQPKADQKEFNLMLDQMRAAIRAEDWAEASRISMRLNAALLNLRVRSASSPLVELQHLDMLAGHDSISRNPLLPRMARAAFAAGDWARAEGLALEALEAAKHGVFWWTGDAIHHGQYRPRPPGSARLQGGGRQTLSVGRGQDAGQFLPRRAWPQHVAGQRPPGPR